MTNIKPGISQREEPLGNSNDDLALGVLPRARLGRSFRRWLGVALIVQFMASGVALIALQAPWRTRFRLGASETIANLAAGRLTDQYLHARNPLARKTLESVATTPGVRFAVVTDAQGRAVMSSSTREAPSVEGNSATTVPPSLADLVPGQSLFLNGMVMTSTPTGQDHAHRLVLATQDSSQGRAMLDGAVAAGVGLLCTLVFVVPFVLRRVQLSTAGLHELHKAIRRLAKGVAPEPIRVDGDDEIAYLGIAFNSMASDIMVTQSALRDANALLERRVAERTTQLAEANVALERKNVMLAEVTDTALRFTDDVAHEFRTPLAVILEFASIIDDGLSGAVSPEQSEHLAFIIDAGRDLSHLVDDFLDSSRLRAGRLPVHRRRHQVGQMVNSVWKMLEAKAAGRNVRLRHSLPPALPVVLADEDKTRRILINLVGNAIKFSKAGDEVLVEARTLGDSVEIRIVDHGPGMSDADVASLFERFRQTSTGARASTKGFGLGLSITAELVAINLGSLSVESVLGSGSTFAFTLPQGNVESIVRSYLDRARECDSSARVGALLVGSRMDTMDPQRLEATLGDLLYPLDLQIPCDDGRSILLLGKTDNTEAWRERLMASAATQSPSTAEGEDPFTIDVVGSWPLSTIQVGGVAAIVAATQCEEVRSV